MARPKFKSWKSAKTGGNAKLGAAVNSALASQAAPYKGQIQHAVNQFDATRQLEDNLLTASNRAIGGYDRNASALSAEQLNRAANLASQSATNVGESREWLGSLFGDMQAPTGPTVGGATAQTNASRLGSQVALNEQQRQGVTQLAQTSALARRHEGVREAWRNRQTQVQSARDQINAIAATRPMLARQFQREDLEGELMRQEIALQQEQMRLQQQQLNSNAMLAARELDQNQQQFDAAQSAAGGQNSATTRAQSAIGALNKALASAQSMMVAGEDPGAAGLAPFTELGLQPGRDFTLTDAGIKLTTTGVKRYFGTNAGLAPNQVYYALKAFDPELAMRYRVIKKNGKWNLQYRAKPNGDTWIYVI